MPKIERGGRNGRSGRADRISKLEDARVAGGAEPGVERRRFPARVGDDRNRLTRRAPLLVGVAVGRIAGDRARLGPRHRWDRVSGGRNHARARRPQKGSEADRENPPHATILNGHADPVKPVRLTRRGDGSTPYVVSNLVPQEVAAPRGFSKVLGSAKEWDGVEPRIEGAPHQTLAANRTADGGDGDDGADVGDRARHPAG